jgi:16S rRNA (guanine527-N7)-methyltransferase
LKLPACFAGDSIIFLSADSIAELLQPYTAPDIAPPADAAYPAPSWPRIYAQLSIYLELILKWNARINLTAIRTPEEIVRRHFGESLFAGIRLGACQTLLDFGSGAGFPGLPIQLLRPDVAVTVAESRSKKAAFLHEVARSLDLPAEVWAGRVEAMPPSRRFDAVTLRAVDNMEAALGEASRRASQRILILGSSRTSLPPELAEEFPVCEQTVLPLTADGVLFELRR